MIFTLLPNRQIMIHPAILGEIKPALIMERKKEFTEAAWSVLYNKFIGEDREYKAEEITARIDKSKSWLYKIIERKQDRGLFNACILCWIITDDDDFIDAILQPAGKTITLTKDRALEDIKKMETLVNNLNKITQAFTEDPIEAGLRKK